MEVNKKSCVPFSGLDYDVNGRMTQMERFKNGEPPTMLVEYDYGYDAVGNRLYTRDMLATDRSELYGYDARNRLRNFERGVLNAEGTAITTPLVDPVLPSQQQWTDLDRRGNWLDFRTMLNGQPAVQQTRTVNGVNEILTLDPDGSGQLPAVTLANDNNGNLTENPWAFNAGDSGTPTGQKYEYDEENRLVRVKRLTSPPDQVLLEIGYDAVGRRVESKEYLDAQTGQILATARVTHHVVLGPMTIEEYTITAGPTATLAREFVWGTEFPMPVAIVDWTAAGQVGTGQAEVLHYLRDVLGNVVALTDAGGNVVERYRYDAYGTTHIYNVGGTPLPTSAYGNPYAYTGQRYDAAVRLYNSWFRTYSPALGRWMQRDPIGYVDGVSLYQYVESGPIDRQDPLGLTRFGPFWPWGIIDDGQPNSPPASQPAPPSAIVAAPPAILGGAGGYWLLGPRGPLFGRGRLRGGNPGWFNRGNFRIGWSWNNFLKKDLFAIHGGRPHTPTHWHIYPFRFMPTHGPVPPWVRFGVRGGQAALVAAAAYVGWEAGSALDSRFGLSKSIGQWIFDELFPKGGGKLIEPCDVVRTTGGNRCY